MTMSIFFYLLKKIYNISELWKKNIDGEIIIALAHYVYFYFSILFSDIKKFIILCWHFRLKNMSQLFINYIQKIKNYIKK